MRLLQQFLEVAHPAGAVLDRHHAQVREPFEEPVRDRDARRAHYLDVRPHPARNLVVE
jgi:hypothetical protein